MARLMVSMSSEIRTFLYMMPYFGMEIVTLKPLLVWLSKIMVPFMA